LIREQEQAEAEDPCDKSQAGDDDDENKKCSVSVALCIP
jgi:hypothetical protein